MNKSGSMNNPMKGLKRTAVSVAIGLCLASGVAYGQAVTGSIFGTTSTAGATVVIENLATGASRTVTADSSGKFTVGQLPAGRYKVTVQQGGRTVESRSNVPVIIGQGSEVLLTGEDLEELDEASVVSTSSARIDTSTVESKIVVTREMMENTPVAQNLTAIAMLAPGVVQGDSRYGNVPSFSGSSISENAYYINGFPVVRGLMGFGYTELPFNAVEQIQVSTGGYGVEYGRATGGVIGVTTRSGSNEWDFGGQVTFRPEDLSASPHNIYYGPNGRTTAIGGAGTLYNYRAKNLSERKSYSGFVSGPIIPDHLFFFVAGEQTEVDGSQTRLARSSAANVTSSLTQGWLDYEDKYPRFLAKVDWEIVEGHTLSVTGIQDRIKDSDATSGFDFSTFEPVGNDPVATYKRDSNTRTYVGNYSGHLFDALTVSAMYGQSKTKYKGGPGTLTDCPYITWDTDSQIAGLTYSTCQTSSSPGYIAGRFDKTEAARLDLEYELGRHTIKVGADYNRVNSLTGGSNDGLNFPGTLGGAYPNGYRWAFRHKNDPNEVVYAPQGVAAPAAGGGYGLQGYYVERVISTNAGTPHVLQRAQYIKDVWRVTDDITLDLGLRNEMFANFGTTGGAFIKKSKQLAPRLGLVWDVEGNSSTKVFVNAGRYHLAVPNNVARRGVDGATNTSEAFVYTGVDPATGAPTGLTSLGPVYSANHEFGQSRDPNTLTPVNVKSHYQDTVAFGLEKNLGYFYGGLKFTWSSLGSAIDDFCDSRQFLTWAENHGYDTDSDAIQAVANDQFGHCVLVNPGADNTYKADLDGDGDYELVDLTKEELGFPKLKRTYTAIDVFLEKPFDGKWYARLDYTLSKSLGNLEGQMNSDIGQLDPAVTLAGDYPELAVNSYGYLPNDRRHAIKLNGYYQITPSFLVGGVFNYTSGRPMNCRGYTPEYNDSPDYGSYYFWCQGHDVPRGTYGRTPDQVRFDLSARYTPQWLKGLTAGVNIYNVTNRQKIASYNELYNNGATTTIHPNWLLPASYQAPRYVELVLQYEFGKSKK